MRQLPVHFRKESWADLRSLLSYLCASGASFNVAESYIGRIVEKCQAIGMAPEGYPARDDITPGLRAAPFERSALITYRIEIDRVEIVNVYYRGQNYNPTI